MSQKHILIIEDDNDISELIQFNLKKEGYHVSAMSHGNELIPFLHNTVPDLIVLDIMLPEKDGLDICRELKQNKQHARIPIIMLTAKSEESDVVTGLELGADDYITKPFSPKILIARIRSALRKLDKNQTNHDSFIEVGGIQINLQKHEVTVDGSVLELTFSEFQILKLLAEKPEWVFSRTQIVDAIRGDNYAVSDRSIDVQIVGLRKKLGDTGKMIHTVRGVGYKIKVA